MGNESLIRHVFRHGCDRDWSFDVDDVVQTGGMGGEVMGMMIREYDCGKKKSASRI